MALRVSRDDALRLARFSLALEGATLILAFLLAIVHAALTRSRFLDSFLLIVFILFLLILVFAVLSGPGAFLSRPRLPPTATDARTRWRRWFVPPQSVTDREFYELVLYTALAFLLLAIATGIAAAVHALGG